MPTGYTYSVDAKGYDLTQQELIDFIIDIAGAFFSGSRDDRDYLKTALSNKNFTEKYYTDEMLSVKKDISKYEKELKSLMNNIDKQYCLYVKDVERETNDNGEKREKSIIKKNNYDNLIKKIKNVNFGRGKFPVNFKKYIFEQLKGFESDYAFSMRYHTPVKLMGKKEWVASRKSMYRAIISNRKGDLKRLENSRKVFLDMVSQLKNIVRQF